MKLTLMTAGIATFLAAGLSGCADVQPGEVDDELSMDAEPQRAGTPEQKLEPPLIGPGPGPSDVYIESISTGGSGCPDPSTVTPVISSDRRSFLLIFDTMILQYPPGSSLQNTNCLAGVRLHIPQGWQFSVATVNTRGYVYVDPGIRARQTSRYSFAGGPYSSQFHTTLWGPRDENYEFTDYIPFESVVWSPCGGSAIFAIDTQLNLNATMNPGGFGLFNSTETDGKFTKVLHFEWLPCAP